jgi:hypothetical protein
VVPVRVELTTFALLARRSDQLSYETDDTKGFIGLLIIYKLTLINTDKNTFLMVILLFCKFLNIGQPMRNF